MISYALAKYLNFSYNHKAHVHLAKYFIMGQSPTMVIL